MRSRGANFREGERRMVVQGNAVPVTALFENLKSGATIEEFLDWFEGVERRQVEAVLDHAEASLVAA